MADFSERIARAKAVKAASKVEGFRKRPESFLMI